MPSSLYHPDIMEGELIVSSHHGGGMTTETEDGHQRDEQHQEALRFALDQLSLIGLEDRGECGGTGETDPTLVGLDDGSCNGVGVGFIGLQMMEHPGGPSSSPTSCSPPPDIFGPGFHMAAQHQHSILGEQVNVIGCRKRSVNMTECVPVPSSEHVAEIVGRQGRCTNYKQIVPCHASKKQLAVKCLITWLCWLQMWRPSFFQDCSISIWELHKDVLQRSSQSPSGKKFRSKPQLARYLGNSMDLSSFDFRTGKMLMSKLNKNRQRLRYDANNQAKARARGQGCLETIQGKPDLNTSLPVRQTASIFKQPVTKVTNHPSNKVKTDPQKAIDQPRQLFWEKKLNGLNAFDIAEELVKTMELPKGLQGVGPGCTDETLLSAIASALHTSTAPITGQLSAAVEKNPGVWLNTTQPLCKAFMVTDEDIR
ncbi:Methyl-CpG-binding domain protein 3 [Acipenser ruthenus]|uniref:Methyl-CpG-binding domain protein 3 n=1 Tax=Acipenser ruthenus TaxID=7906 RepID=A0A662YPU3_ACIRT|nr:Methyl-CpG-binding domain protein 3 [Acipenser ruthenus]